MEIIKKYFPYLTPKQEEQFGMLGSLYADWNEKVNVVSRKDIENLYEKHVLHSLAIAKFIKFNDGIKVLDAGTGGGFPGIPLAIYFPKVYFHLIDSIGKKIMVVNEVIEALGLKNALGEQVRLEQIKGQYDFIVSRAVTQLPQFAQWSYGKIRKKKTHQEVPNGIIYLKGGDFEEELVSVRQHSRVHPISKYFEEEFFETKKIAHLWLPKSAR